MEPLHAMAKTRSGKGQSPTSQNVSTIATRTRRKAADMANDSPTAKRTRVSKEATGDEGSSHQRADDAQDDVQETSAVEETHPASEEDSDDEAPEAVSTAQSKDLARKQETARQEAKQSAMASEKEKRRQWDQKLKEQKEQSKKRRIDIKPSVEPQEDEGNKEHEEESLEGKETDMKDVVTQDQDEEASGDAQSGDNDNDNDENEIILQQDSRFLPQELLDEFAKTEGESPKARRHLRAEDLEEILRKEEEEEAKQKSGHPKQKKGRQPWRKVGSPFAVKVLNKKPGVQAGVPEHITSFRDQHFFGNRVPRRDVILNVSQRTKGPAAVFSRKSGV
ncbi:hypothetical protein BZG36_03859 [Bifiguratus adelaidae]|uniref:Uncharacterized protein n=1 Tax=Bifiguratus adelaidae TaxID=1938954 RepID=A0A261XWT9_9FUNG|nr:hypothetical protein BZG36_03859 [Bifiguratus adelaidae]